MQSKQKLGCLFGVDWGIGEEKYVWRVEDMIKNMDRVRDE